jgi:hypothetical protein
MHNRFRGRVVWLVSFIVASSSDMIALVWQGDLVGGEIGLADDFNDNSKDEAKWGPVVNLGTTGVITERNCRLEFSGTGVGNEVAFWPWIASYGNYTENWDALSIKGFPLTKTPATVTLGGLWQFYDGAPKTATATTTPAGLPVTFTYDGSANAPINAGSYMVIGTIYSLTYQGSATNTLIIVQSRVQLGAPSCTSMPVGWRADD